MTTKIVLLGQKGSGKSELVTAFQYRRERRDEKKHGDILVRSSHSVVGQSSADTFNFYYTADNEGLEESKVDLRYYTSVSEAVIYTVGFRADETVEQFKARVEQDVAIQKPFDHSDSHAVKVLAITNAELLSEKDEGQNRIKFQAMIQFALSQRMELFYISNVNTQNVFREITQKIAEKTIPLNFLSRLTGYILFTIIQTVTSLVLSNPLASFFAVLERCRWNNLKNIGMNFVSVTLFPLWYPLFIMASSLLYNPGWFKGVLSSFEASSKNIRADLYDNRGNVIASIVIGGLITVAVLITVGVFGPLVIGGVGLAALAVKGATITAGFLGLNGAGVLGLAVIAGAVMGITSSLLYGLGYGLYRFVKSFDGAEPAPARSSEFSGQPSQPPVLRVIPITNREQQQPRHHDSFAASYGHPVHVNPTIPGSDAPMHHSSYIELIS